jgi:hypothetical protein
MRLAAVKLQDDLSIDASSRLGFSNASDDPLTWRWCSGFEVPPGLGHTSEMPLQSEIISL